MYDRLRTNYSMIGETYCIRKALRKLHEIFSNKMTQDEWILEQRVLLNGEEFLRVDFSIVDAVSSHEVLGVAEGLYVYYVLHLPGNTEDIPAKFKYCNENVYHLAVPINEDREESNLADISACLDYVLLE